MESFSEDAINKKYIQVNNYEIVLLICVFVCFLWRLDVLTVPVQQTEGFKNIYILFIYSCFLYRFFKLYVSS